MSWFSSLIRLSHIDPLRKRWSAIDIYSSLFCNCAQGAIRSVKRFRSTSYHSTSCILLFQSLTVSQITTSYQRYLPGTPPLIHLLWLKGLYSQLTKNTKLTLKRTPRFRRVPVNIEVDFVTSLRSITTTWCLDIAYNTIITLRLPTKAYVNCYFNTHKYHHTLARSRSLIEIPGNEHSQTQHAALLTSSNGRPIPLTHLRYFSRVTHDECSYTQGYVNTHKVLLKSLCDYTHTHVHTNAHTRQFLHTRFRILDYSNKSVLTRNIAWYYHISQYAIGGLP